MAQPLIGGIGQPSHDLFLASRGHGDEIGLA
jgi:hypothetical protein